MNEIENSSGAENNFAPEKAEKISDAEIIPPEQKNSWTSWAYWKENLKFIVILLLIVIPFRLYIAQPFLVSGASMDPTFETGDYLIVDEISYKFAPPKRGDVIVFNAPFLGGKYLIKRIVGLPGEFIKINGAQTLIASSSDTQDKAMLLKEPYVVKQRDDVQQEYQLASDEYFVLGDNRVESADSRIWGALKAKLITGRAFLRLWPMSEIGVWPGK